MDALSEGDAACDMLQRTLSLHQQANLPETLKDELVGPAFYSATRLLYLHLPPHGKLFARIKAPCVATSLRISIYVVREPG